MKKIPFTTALCIIFSVFLYAQKKEKEKSSRLEQTNFDNRWLISSATYMSSSLVGNIGAQTDARGTFSFSGGPILFKKKIIKPKLAPMIGLAYDADRDEWLYTLGVFTENRERSKEISINAKRLKVFEKRGREKYLVEAEILFDISNTLSLGASIAVESEKYKSELNHEEVIRYDALTLVGPELKWQAKSFGDFYTILFIGWGNYVPDGKNLFRWLDFKKENLIIYKIGVGCRF